MLINRTDIQALYQLSIADDLVAIEKIPLAFKDDFDTFFFGKTLTKKGTEIFAYPQDIKRWVKYLCEKY